jgi:hypothetical protein
VAKPKRPHTKKFLHQSFPKNAPKVMVYEALAGFNRNFEQVLLDLERLATWDLFVERWQRRAFKACRATLEEMRASANFEVIEVLHQTEERDWTRLARRADGWRTCLRLPTEVSVPTNQSCESPRADEIRRWSSGRKPNPMKSAEIT